MKNIKIIDAIKEFIDYFKFTEKVVDKIKFEQLDKAMLKSLCNMRGQGSYNISMGNVITREQHRDIINTKIKY